MIAGPAKYVLRDLPGIRDLENDLVLANRLGGVDEQLQKRIDAVSRSLFGIVQQDAEPEYPDIPDPTGSEAEWAAYRAAYEAYNHAEGKLCEVDPEEVGWDFKDDRGRELLVAEYFEDQIRAVHAGFAGHMPGERGDTPLSADEERDVEKRLAAEAAKWKRPKDRDR